MGRTTKKEKKKEMQTQRLAHHFQLVQIANSSEAITLRSKGVCMYADRHKSLKRMNEIAMNI